MKKVINIWVQSFFYLFAGIYHFLNPQFYYDLIPPYLPWPYWINILAGIAEIVLAIGLINRATRKKAANGIIILLIAFVPSHIYFIQVGSCIEDGLCVAPWIGWIRLLLIHPILIYWAWTAKS